jgi:hypothetical protein
LIYSWRTPLSTRKGKIIPPPPQFAKSKEIKKKDLYYLETEQMSYKFWKTNI